MSFTKYFKPYSCVFVFMHGHSRIVNQNFVFRGKKYKIPIQKLMYLYCSCTDSTGSMFQCLSLSHCYLCSRAPDPVHGEGGGGSPTAASLLLPHSLHDRSDLWVLPVKPAVLVYEIIHEHIVGFVAYKMTLCSFGVHVALFLVSHHLQYGATEHVWAWEQGYF